jgi:hypothetical protein
MPADEKDAMLILAKKHPQVQVIEVNIGMSREFLLRPILNLP